MDFTYDLDDDTLYVHLRPAPSVLRQIVENVTISIDAAGAVCALDILHPGAQEWPIMALLYRYPFEVGESYFLVTLAARYLSFRF